MFDISLPFIVGNVESFEKCGLSSQGHRKSLDGIQMIVHSHDKRVNKTMRLKFKLYNDIIEYSIEDIKEMMKLDDWFSPDEEIISLDTYKMDKIIILKAECEKAIKDGFDSDASGAMRHYDCQDHDQANIMGQCMSAMMEKMNGTDNTIGFKISGDFACTQFSPDAMIKLGMDMRAHIEATVEKVGMLVGQVFGATSKGEVDGINW